MRNKEKKVLIEKKIDKVLESMTDDLVRNYKIIIKNFGSIDYQYKGDSLYHLFFSVPAQERDRTYWIIKTLQEYGLDINICNNENKTFIQCASKVCLANIINNIDLIKDIDFNHQDNNGRTILHNLVEKGFSIEKMDWAYTMLIDDIDATIKDNNGQTFLDLIDERNNDDFTNVDELYLRNLKRKYYEKNFTCFLDKLNNNPIEVANFLESLFLNKNEVQQWCQNNEYISEEEKLKALEKLFACGINPNHINIYMSTLINHVIKTGDFSMKYQLNLTKLCLDYGYQVNDPPTIMETKFKNYKSIQELLNMYVLLSQYGYNKLAYDMETSEIENAEEVYQIIKNEGFLMMMDVLLKEHKLVIDYTCLSDSDFLNYIFEVKELVKKTLKMDNDFGMAELIATKIMEAREGNINLIEDNVSLKEVTCSIKTILEEHISNVVKPMIKVLDKYN